MSCATSLVSVFFFFFNDTATTEIYTLPLHDALPICVEDGEREQDPGDVVLCGARAGGAGSDEPGPEEQADPETAVGRDRKSTRLNSSHGYISYAVFCLKKKKTR